ncbi:hypothetical protein B4N89_00750 [Embleya scabrispora]|uniref:CN hydrolase domain-containing protein n=1 Tax=Embleya scabrispora TaxID=159449 RepID=A0A1T3NS82_9ACTN|nr:carbon-nitrogen hydrolase family protein [Embleya scabrispora]OPC79668.1 hypothetical protein B4N89_00750 [Embleya scabrispora]
MHEHGTASTVTVAAAQFAVGTDREENLKACLRAIDEAAGRGARIVVLPEFCNHLSWYPDRAAARRLACREGDAFLTALAERAARHAMYVKTGVTYAHPDGRTCGTGVLHGPDGRVLALADKQILMGSENDFLDPAVTPSPVVPTPYGPVGLYACMEGVITEPARCLAVRGARLLLNSLNSFATDEASLHVPVRAAENRVWVVAANKIGPLVPADTAAAVAAGLGIPRDRLHGAGESRIVAPDGSVVARAPATGAAVIVAHIDLALADDKRRPDGTDVFATRRPRVYAPLAAGGPHTHRTPGADRALARIIHPAGTGREAVTDAAELLREAVADGIDLVVLPELFFLPPPDDDPVATGTPARATALAAFARTTVTRALRGGRTHAVLSLPAPEGDAHLGHVIGPEGSVHIQPRLHHSARHRTWTTREPGDTLGVVDLPFGRLAVLVGDDLLYPETARLAAIAGAEVVAAPYTPALPWEFTLGLPERAAENRINLVAAGRERPALPTPPGAIFALPPDFGLWTTRTEPFTGRISHPVVTPQTGRATTAEIRPALAAHRLVSRGTDLVDGRPRHLLNALVTPPSNAHPARVEKGSPR